MAAEDVAAVGDVADVSHSGTAARMEPAAQVVPVVARAVAAWAVAAGEQRCGMGRSVAVESSEPPSGFSTLRGGRVIGLDVDGSSFASW